MPNVHTRWGNEGVQAEPGDTKKDAGFKPGRREVPDYFNWLMARVSAGVSLDREECLLHMPLSNSLEMMKGLGSVTFARDTVATYVDRYGVVRAAAIDEPRFEAQGLLMEGESINDFTRSEEFDHGDWTKFGLAGTPIIADSVVAPDGTMTADEPVEDSANSQHYLLEIIGVVSVDDAYAVSCFIKRKAGGTHNMYLTGFGEGYSVFNPDDGTVVQTGGNLVFVIPLANDWFRVIAVITKTNTNGGFYIGGWLGGNSYLGDGVSHHYLWGAQVEKLLFASSYIPTVGSTVTRTKDTCSVTMIENAPLQAESCAILCDVEIFSAKGSEQRMITVLGETYRIIQADPLGSFYGNSGVVIGSTVQSSNIPYRIGLRYDGTDADFWVNGVKKGTEAVSDATDVLGTQIDIGQSLGAGSLYGHLRNFRIYGRALTDFEMAIA